MSHIGDAGLYYEPGCHKYVTTVYIESPIMESVTIIVLYQVLLYIFVSRKMNQMWALLFLAAADWRERRRAGHDGARTDAGATQQ